MKAISFGLSLLLTFFLSRMNAAPLKAGRVIGWGDNSLGQITGMPSALPGGTAGFACVEGNQLTNVIAISAGAGFSLALSDDGIVLGWGDNRANQAIGYAPLFSTNGVVRLGGEALDNVIQITAGAGNSLALKKDGAIAGWGDISLPLDISVGSDFTAVSVGKSLALRRNGTLVSFGGFYDRSPKGLSNIVALPPRERGGLWNTALMNDGRVAEWNVRGPEPGAPIINVTNKDDFSVQPAYPLLEYQIVEGLSNVIALASENYNFLALKADGTVFQWSLESGTTWITTNSPDSGLVKINGKVLTNVVAISAGNQFCLALKNDGTIAQWGNYMPDVPIGLSNIVAIAAGDNFCLAITTSTNLSNLKK